jgi:hypothetical protein
VAFAEFVTITAARLRLIFTGLPHFSMAEYTEKIVWVQLIIKKTSKKALTHLSAESAGWRRRRKGAKYHTCAP